MPEEVGPLIQIIAAPDDARRVAPVAAQLTQRGFAVHTAATQVDSLSPPLLTLIAVGPSLNQSGDVLKAATRALATKTRVLPLILSARADTPDFLAQLQWVDFSGAFESGWLDLLVTLDRAGVTRYPPAPGWFDWEMALARAYRGHVPPDWRAYRISPSYYQRLTNNVPRCSGLVASSSSPRSSPIPQSGGASRPKILQSDSLPVSVCCPCLLVGYAALMLGLRTCNETR